MGLYCRAVAGYGGVLRVWIISASGGDYTHGGGHAVPYRLAYKRPSCCGDYTHGDDHAVPCRFAYKRPSYCDANAHGQAAPALQRAVPHDH